MQITVRINDPVMLEQLADLKKKLRLTSPEQVVLLALERLWLAERRTR